MNIVDRFLKYVSFETTSDENTGTTPSTPGQMTLAKYLAEELQQIGMQDVTLDQNGYIMATLPANTEGKPTIGFIAHMDTAPDASGKHVKARIVENYDGQNIVLNEEKNIIFEVAKYPEILDYTGQDIIVTDGTTLLGADDKAGLAEIVTACEYLIQHPEIKHGKIRVGFTPDEEIGQGADHFDVKKFGCDFAYTMDGGAVGEVGTVVLNDRKLLAQDGMVVVVLTMSSHDHQLLCDPEIITRGFVYVKESEELLAEMRRVAMETVSKLPAKRRRDDGEVCRAAKSAVSSYLFKNMKRSPMVIPTITRL